MIKKIDSNFKFWPKNKVLTLAFSLTACSREQFGFYLYECNFPMNPDVRLSVGWSVIIFQNVAMAMERNA